MNEGGRKNYTFINEHIKKKPFYKKKWFLKTAATVGTAAVFGLAAGLTIGIVTPWAKQQFGEPEKPTQIVIAEETEENTENISGTSHTETQKETAKPDPVIEKKELGILDYKKLYELMSGVADQAFKSLVTVSGSSRGMDWFEQDSQDQVEASGLIVADLGSNLYILTDTRVTDAAEQIQVTFSDGAAAEGVFQKQDAISGLAVVRVSTSKLSEETRNSFETASLASASFLSKGCPVIVLGSPLGYSDSMAYGMITAIHPTSTVDRSYHLLTTDIIGSEEASGIIITLEGKIVGIISNNFKDQNLESTVSGLLISETKEVIEKLTNNTEVAYLGITGKEIPQSIQTESGMPKGIYIKQVEIDSPAMYSVIQMGDVLVSINGTKITDMNEYNEKLMSHNPGDTVNMIIMRKGIDNVYAEINVGVTLGSTF